MDCDNLVIDKGCDKKTTTPMRKKGIVIYSFGLMSHQLCGRRDKTCIGKQGRTRKLPAHNLLRTDVVGGDASLYPVI